MSLYTRCKEVRRSNVREVRAIGDCLTPDFAWTVAELRRRQCFRDGRAVVRRAFDRGVTHFDLANNYGPRTVLPRRTSGDSAEGF